MQFNNFCRNVPGTFDGHYWVVDSATATILPTLTGGVLTDTYELNGIEIVSGNGTAASYHSIDGIQYVDFIHLFNQSIQNLFLHLSCRTTGELLIWFIKSSFAGDYDAAVAEDYGIAYLSLLISDGTTGEWFEVRINS